MLELKPGSISIHAVMLVGYKWRATGVYNREQYDEVYRGIERHRKVLTCTPDAKKHSSQSGKLPDIKSKKKKLPSGEKTITLADDIALLVVGDAHRIVEMSVT